MIIILGNLRILKFSNNFEKFKEVRKTKYKIRENKMNNQEYN